MVFLDTWHPDPQRLQGSMKAILSTLILLSGSLPVHAEEKTSLDQSTVQALGRLDKKLDTTFDIPFPTTQVDGDRYLIQPIGIVIVDGKKVRITRPIQNPYDGAHTIEWNIGPEDAAKFGREHVHCHFNFNGQGEIIQIGMLASDSWATAKGGSNSLSIVDGELPAGFFKRAIEAFRLRARKAKDPVQAELVVSAFEKVAISLQSLRKEEVSRKP
jgi:hypothetical protein